MATVSGTFTAVGQSATLDVPILGEEITISLTGTWVGTVRVEREKVPHSDVWQTVRTYVGNVETSFRQERKNERYRFNMVAYTSGTVTYSIDDAVHTLAGWDILHPDTGEQLMHLTEDGLVVDDTLTVDGTTTLTGAVTMSAASTLASGTTIGNLTLADGSITDSSGAISLGNENISTTGTLASGALSVTGAISDTAASSFTTAATIGNLTLGDGSIVDSSGAISFGNENLSTTGTLASGALTVTGAISDTVASTLTTGATIGNITLANGSITDSSGALDFGNETLTTTGAVATGALTVTGAAIFADGATDVDIASHDATNGLKLGGVLVSATAAEINLLDGSSATAPVVSTAAILDNAGALRTAENVGTAGTGVTAVEYGDGYNHVTVLTTTTSTVLDADIDDNETIAVGAIIYTFPAGVYVGHSIHLDITAFHAVDLDNSADVGAGSVIGSGASATLNGTTMEDWLTGQTVDMSSSTGATEKSTLMTAGNNLLFEAAGSHVLNLNAAAVWNSTGATSNQELHAVGTVTIAWTFLGA